MELFEKVFLVVLGTLLSGIAYLLKRRVEKRPISDALEKHQKLLSINKELAGQKISVEDLHALEQSLVRRGSQKEVYIGDLRKELSSVSDENNDEFFSNWEMKIRASGNVKIAEAKLEQIFEELSFKLGKEEKGVLEKSQKAWEIYSRKQAEFAAGSFRGGTGESLVYMLELESLIVDRVASLQSMLDEIRKS